MAAREGLHCTNSRLSESLRRLSENGGNGFSLGENALCLEPPSHQDSSRRCHCRRCHCRKFHGRRDEPPSTPATIGIVVGEKLRESLLFPVFLPACDTGSLLLPEDAIDATPVTTTVSTSAAVNGVKDEDDNGGIERREQNEKKPPSEEVESMNERTLVIFVVPLLCSFPTSRRGIRLKADVASCSLLLQSS
ncbi:hypothetical protein DEO72_LG8g1226 [Vigna unguiculata]|uniref:Uncharacterized protein n=1 Tax=Vigna unguiculata TaxID=3917 RepID=A0A4D6MR37_VIGUN|nr:hypothetical protein DEO72_LG8g1226 [Vigna unguiculata]